MTLNKFTLLLSFLLITNLIEAQELFQMQDSKHARWVSFENISGAKANGGRENAGAKGHAFNSLLAGESVDLVNLKGSGTVRRIWMTMNDRTPEMMRSLKLEIFWDGSDKPAVSAPLGDFFGVGLGRRLAFESALFSDPEGRSYNCFIPMPFKTSARITLTNESEKELIALFYDVDILMEEHTEDMLYFHTYWSRALETELEKDFQILPKIEGKGRFLGTNIGVFTNKLYEDTWFGEGEVKIYLDGDKELPTLIGTGTEDYIGTAYGQGTFSNQYQGSLIADPKKGEYAFYRYHIPDPIFFYDNIQVDIQQIGGAPKEKVIEMQENGAVLKPISIHNELTFIKLLEQPQPIDLKDPDLLNGWTNFYRQDDVSATAYFYLNSPTSSLPPLAGLENRISQLSNK